MHTRAWGHRSAAAVLAALVLTPVTARAADPPLLRMRAFAVNLSGVGRGGATTLDIVVERWSTDEERAKLRGVLVEQGRDKLLDALQDVKPRVGYIRGSRTLGWDLHFAREIPTPDGGRRIIIASDRPMSFREVANRPRSADYEFLVVEIRLDKDGQGQGKLASAAKVDYNRETNTVEIENYANEPVRLTKVTVEEPKAKK